MVEQKKHNDRELPMELCLIISYCPRYIRLPHLHQYFHGGIFILSLSGYYGILNNTSNLIPEVKTSLHLT